MDINQAWRIVNFVANKQQKGKILPSDFNALAVQAQFECMLNCLGNQKRVNPKFIPPTGYKVNQQSKEDILPLIVKSPTPLSLSAGIAPYPSDFFSYDNLLRADGTIVTMIENDQLGRMKKSLITPPIDSEPFACMHSEGIEIAPAGLTDVYLTYVKRPADPNWDYTIDHQIFVYNSTATPQLSGKISHNFEMPERKHKEICMIILKYIGINLSDEALTQFATQVQETQP